MKKGLLSSIVLIAICVAVLFVGVFSSANLCSKDRSFICSAFTFIFNESASPTVIAPDKDYAKFYVYPDLIYHQELASSIFHPPRITS